MTTNNPTSPREELEPCPFCGGKAAFKPRPNRPNGMIVLGCADPDCVGHDVAFDFVTEDLAAAAWNTRPPVKASSPEGFRAALEKISDAAQDEVSTFDDLIAIADGALSTPPASERAEVAAIPSRDVIAAVINAWDDTLNPGGLVYEDIEARLCKDPRIISSTGQHTGKL